MARRSRENLVNFLIIIGLFLAAAGCIIPSTKERGQALPANGPPAAAPESSLESPAKKEPKGTADEDRGDFTVKFGGITNARYAEIDKRIKAERILENAASDLNASIALPHDIFLQTKDCDEVNALYDPNDHSITVCYELMEHFYKLFKSNGGSEKEAYEKMFSAVTFVFLHELGHALIDAHEIPIAGSEEDASDRLSTYICLEELGDNGASAAIAAAEAFRIEAEDSDSRELAFYDNHKLGAQRFYDIMCSLYGHDSQRYDYILSEGLLPKERAQSCGSEYQRLSSSWGKLLQRIRKKK